MGPHEHDAHTRAAAIIAGVIAGTILGQPSIGFLAGTGVGLLVALFLWWRDRRR